MKNNKVKFIILPTLICTSCLTGCVKQYEEADFVVYAHQIFTADDKDSFVEAFAVKDGKYIATGKTEKVLHYEGPKTKIYHESFVMPGAIEPHGHFILGEAFKLGLYINPVNDLGNPKSYDVILDEIKAYKNKNPNLTKILGYGFDSSVNGLPPSLLLEDDFKDIPVLIMEKSLHGGIANAACLKAAGLYDESDDVKTIIRDENGVPTGIVLDAAVDYIENKVFGQLVDDENYKLAVKNAAKTLNSLGYVGHYDMWSNFDGTTSMYKAIKDVDEQEGLSCYFSNAYCIYPEDNVDEKIGEAKILKVDYNSAHQKANFVKLFADGGIETGTGYVTKPYIGTEDNFGIKYWEQEDMNSLVDKANKNDLMVHIHTMGDAAVNEAINAYYESIKANGNYRNSLGHVGLISSSDLSRIKNAKIGVAAGANWGSQISNEAIEGLTSTFIEEDRVRSLYPCEQYYQYGINAAASTDTPCGTGASEVFDYIETIVTGKDPTIPDAPVRRQVNENLRPTIKYAINMLTSNGAWMANMEEDRGSIEVGKYADFLFATGNPFQVGKSEIHNIKVKNTFFEGKIVYSMEEN